MDSRGTGFSLLAMKRVVFPLAMATMFAFAPGCSGSGSSGPQVADSLSLEASRTSQDYVEAERIPSNAVPEAAPERVADTGGVRFRGGLLRVNGKSLEILDSLGNTIMKNPSILRLLDEGGQCPSEGFQRIAVKGDYFTIEQQSCGGMLFIDEYITFKATSDGRIYLHRFSIVKTDREDPERVIPQQDLTTKNFGQIGFEDVALRSLYEMF